MFFLLNHYSRGIWCYIRPDFVGLFPLINQRSNLDGGTPKSRWGTLKLDGGTRPPRFPLQFKYWVYYNMFKFTISNSILPSSLFLRQFVFFFVSFCSPCMEKLQVFGAFPNPCLACSKVYYKFTNYTQKYNGSLE